MIYIPGGDGTRALIILEPANIDWIKDGKVAVSPDQQVGVMYSPDTHWLGQQLLTAMKAGILNPAVLDDLVKESQARPEVWYRDPHPMRHIVKDGQVGEEMP